MLDAHALIAFFTEEPASAKVIDLIENRDDVLGMNPINVGEAVDHLIRVRREPRTRVLTGISRLRLMPIAVDRGSATAAGLLRAKHYHRTRRPVSIADCFAAASALGHSERPTLATADPTLLDLVHEEGGRVLPLPSVDGSTWEPQTL